MGIILADPEGPRGRQPLAQVPSTPRSRRLTWELPCAVMAAACPPRFSSRLDHSFVLACSWSDSQDGATSGSLPALTPWHESALGWVLRDEWTHAAAGSRFRAGVCALWLAIGPCGDACGVLGLLLAGNSKTGTPGSEQGRVNCCRRGQFRAITPRSGILTPILKPIFHQIRLLMSILMESYILRCVQVWVGLGIFSQSEGPIILPHFRARFDAVDVGKCMNFYLDTLLRRRSLPRPCFVVFLKH